MKYLLVRIAICLAILISGIGIPKAQDISKPYNPRNLTYLGTGEIGGYIDVLGLNSEVYKYVPQSKADNAVPMFQSKEMFGPLPTYKKDYYGNSRAALVKLETQPLVNGHFSPDSIKNYKQDIFLEKAMVVTQFDYGRAFRFRIESVADYSSKRIILFRISFYNKSATDVNFEVRRTVTDDQTKTKYPHSMQAYPSPNGLTVGYSASEYSENKAVCNRPMGKTVIKTGESVTDAGYFSLSSNFSTVDAADAVKTGIALGADSLIARHLNAAQKNWKVGKLTFANPDYNLIYKLCKYSVWVT